MSVLLAAPLLLSLTLLVSGVAKLGAREDTTDAMTSLRLPARRLHRSVAAALPIAEIVLGLALWVPVGAVQVTASVLVAALMAAYLAIIARALTFEEPVECSCFGTLASPTVSGSTLARNVVLTALGVGAVVAASTGEMARSVLDSPLALLGWGGALAVSIVLTALALGGPDSAPASGPGQAGPVDRAHPDGPEGAARPRDPETSSPELEEELLDYERAPIPAGVLQRADGSLLTLRQLAAQQAALLIFVSEGCGPCERVMDHLPRWLETLTPFMQVTTVFRRPVDGLRERTAQRVGTHALHDLQFSAREALGAKTAPSAVLLGADGLLAGGPVTGGSGVIEFVDEIQEQLTAAQQDGALQGGSE